MSKALFQRHRARKHVVLYFLSKPQFFSSQLALLFLLLFERFPTSGTVTMAFSKSPSSVSRFLSRFTDCPAGPPQSFYCFASFIVVGSLEPILVMLFNMPAAPNFISACKPVFTKPGIARLHLTWDPDVQVYPGINLITAA